jgi:AraC-like DNA-binding protein
MVSGSPAWWSLPLAEPPRLVQVGLGRHGERRVERYRLPSLWVMHLYDYAAALRLDGRPVAIEPGSVGVTPPGVEMAYRYSGRVEHLYAHFAVVGGVDAGEGAVRVPAMQRPERGVFERWRRMLWEVIGESTHRPIRARARFWELLWRVVDESAVGDEASTAPRMERREVAEAKRIIERRLSEPIRVADIAEAVGLSHNHLTRLFREAEGTTVMGYLNGRRAERARHLLQQTTRPIKAIAMELGMSDPAHFNKFIRQRLGRSPSAVRAEAAGVEAGD